MAGRMTAAAFKRFAGNGTTTSKYRNKKTIGFDKDGGVVKLDSKREARRWALLQLREKRGEIIELQRQVSYEFPPKSEQARDGKVLRGPPSKNRGVRVKVRYVADFVYRFAPGHGNGEGGWVVEDVKGMRTDAYRLKWALMDFFYDIQVKEV